MKEKLNIITAEKLKESVEKEVDFYMRQYVACVEQGLMSPHTTAHIELTVDGMPAPPLKTKISASEP